LTMFCAAVFAGIWLNRDKTVRTEYQIATMRAVSGLNPQASVRYKGLAVGRVDKIDFDETVAGQILIDISIDPDTPITQSTFATLGYQGVTGIAYVQLDDDGSKSVKVNIVAGQVPRIPLRPGLFESIELSGTKILANAELVTERLSQLFTTENQKTMLAAFSSTKEATARWSQVADELSPTIQMMPGMVQQTGQTLKSVQELSNSATQLSQQLTGLTRQLQDPNGALNHSLTTVSNLSDSIQSDTLPKISTLTTNASNSMRSFDQTMDEIKEHPQNLLFGKPAPVPGPGEAGFVEPKH
jgi:phospholipid/cholesterol/gamma-HCH transport system substrate-binding protein